MKTMNKLPRKRIYASWVLDPEVDHSNEERAANIKAGLEEIFRIERSPCTELTVHVVDLPALDDQEDKPNGT